MSSGDYTIIIHNESGSNNQYLILGEPPQALSTNTTAYSNAWIVTDGTPSPHGSQRIRISQETFAVCGIVPESLVHGGAAVLETEFAEVDFTGTGGTTLQMSIIADSPTFETSDPSAKTTVPNCFEIKTNDWDTKQFPNKFWYGLGKKNEHDNVIPLATYPALPNQSYIIQPNLKFYVCTETFQTGTIIDVTQLGTTVTIDFSKAHPGQTIATITHNSHLKYDGPVFSWPGDNTEPQKSTPA